MTKFTIADSPNMFWIMIFQAMRQAEKRTGRKSQIITRMKIFVHLTYILMIMTDIEKSEWPKKAFG